MPRLFSAHDANFRIASSAESAASNPNRAFDAFALRDGEQQFIFPDAADKRPARFDSGWKTVRDSRRKSALDVHIDPDARVYTTYVFHCVEKSAARVRSEKRIAWNWIAQCWLGNWTSEERRNIGHAERSCGVKIKINPSRRDAPDR